MGLTKEQRKTGLRSAAALRMFVDDPTLYRATIDAVNWSGSPQGNDFWYEIHQQSVRKEDLEGLRHRVIVAAIENGWAEHLGLTEISDDLLWE